MTTCPIIPYELERAYFEKFHRPIPQFISQGDELANQILAEALKAMAGERDYLDPNEFEVDCPPGALL